MGGFDACTGKGRWGDNAMTEYCIGRPGDKPLNEIYTELRPGDYVYCPNMGSATISAPPKDEFGKRASVAIISEGGTTWLTGKEAAIEEIKGQPFYAPNEQSSPAAEGSPRGA